MTSINVLIVVITFCILILMLSIYQYRRKKHELEQRLSLIEHHVLRLEKNLRKKIVDLSDNTFAISKGLIELIDEKR